MKRRFRGESVNKVDAKGRVSVPAAFRRALEEGDPDSPASAAAANRSASIASSMLSAWVRPSLPVNPPTHCTLETFRPAARIVSLTVWSQ